MPLAPGQVGKLSTSDCALFVCDVQERFRTVIAGMPAVIDTSRRMLRAAHELQIPVVITEQYPKALGSTVEELAAHVPEGSPVVAKTKFSMMVPEVRDYLSSLSMIHKILLVGIEAHVCVLQTTLDLIENGYEVHIVVDGVSSSRLADRAVAFQRMVQAGALLCTSEMVLFQVMEDAKAPGFKAVSALAKEKRPTMLPVPSML
ncbi:hypothetical protein BSKO_06334 [Bryopsis sp. KO-2023]|nr:hypothetical protein BSKO_06334 [Bryopsis sp. KO-2023]